MDAARIEAICGDREMFRDGDVLAEHAITAWYKPWTWLDARIQQTTRSRWNHVGLLFFVAGRWVVREALWHVQATPLETYLRDRGAEVAVFRHPAMFGESGEVVARRAAMARWSLAQMGEPYDWTTILKIRLLQLVLGYREVGGIGAIRSATADDRHWICSAYDIGAFASASLILELGKYASPENVVALLAIVWESRRNLEVYHG
jgi:hypothetical protein